MLEERLRRVRILAGLSARGLDALAGVAQNHTANIESGRLGADVKISTARKYASVFGVSLDWLVAGKGPEPREKDVLAAVARARGEKAA